MTREQTAIVTLNEFTQALHKLAKLHDAKIAALEAETARLLMHIEGLQAKAMLSRRKRA